MARKINEKIIQRKKNPGQNKLKKNDLMLNYRGIIRQGRLKVKEILHSLEVQKFKR